jgi:V-type H+-transporting ATPase subunit H
MATEAEGLLEKYKVAGASDLSKAAETHNRILSFKPDWDQYEATKSVANIMKLIEADQPAMKNKALIQGNIAVLQSSMNALSMQDEKPMQYLLTLFYDLLREDSSSYSIFEEGVKNQINVYKPLAALISRAGVDSYSADKAAWLLSAVMCHLPRTVTEDQVSSFLDALLDPKSTVTELGVLEAITNLLKSDAFRRLTWAHKGVADLILSIEPKTAPSPYLYKCIFSIWMLSFDTDITKALKDAQIVKKLKDTLTFSRVEKVIRVSLTVLRNFLTVKALCEDIVEDNILEAVQQLESEKWRDPELYDEIRDMSMQISTEVNEMSNFDRYERELQTGQLHWGFIHSSKFWVDNVLKFESNDFRALKMLASLLQSDGTDATTLAVACHDLGEFVTLHPLGKKKVAQLQVKEKVMELMSSTDPAYREVRREALLCCQKIMLNKWQDMEQPK